jgi:heptaprenyl diphosphate synthase
MTPAFLSPSLLKLANEVFNWANEFLIPESEQIHRPHGNQSVCPFVGASIEHDCFFMVFHPEINQHSEQLIEQLLVNYIPLFGRLGPFEPSDKLKKALLVVFPSIPEKQTRILDRAYSNIKTRFVDAAMMIGQFHVSRSPVPLMVIRHMALHDILFLAENEEWFRAYNVQFGHRFNEPNKIESYNKHLMEYYVKAKEKFMR